MMFMRIFGVIVFLAMVTGCANKPDVDNSSAFWNNKSSRVVIVTTKANKPSYVDMNADSGSPLAGVVSLLMTQKLQSHLEQMDMNWYYDTLAHRFQSELAKENIKAVVAKEHPYGDNSSLFDMPHLNRTQLAAEYQADQVLVLNVFFYGARTPMHGLFEGKPPMEGFCGLNGELSDPQHKTVSWRHSSRVTKSMASADFSDVTQAVVASHEGASAELLNSFISGR